MLISRKNDDACRPVKIGEQPSCKVSQYEYLGVIFDKEFKMVTHVESIFRKAYSKIVIVAKI